MKDMDKRHELVRAVVGPMEDLKRLGMLDTMSPLRAEMANVSRAVDLYNAQFRLPEVAEITRLSAEIFSLGKPTLLERLNPAAAALEAMEAMHSPWMRQQQEMLSIRGFAELQGIGSALKTMPMFGSELTAALRGDLGDWRDIITWPAAIFTDLDARAAFYIDRGLNPSLTDFPVPAFRQGVELAGLLRKPASLANLYGEPVPSEDEPAVEDGLVRTNIAHDWLLRFEIRFRRFIDELMTDMFGSDWPRHRLPNGLHDKWQDKKRRAEEGGGKIHALIDYADFTDYAEIICRGDNWKKVFSRFFGRPESVRESLQRLYPIRVCTMHARPITQDDQLFLYVEVKRLVTAIE